MLAATLRRVRRGSAAGSARDDVQFSAFETDAITSIAGRPAARRTSACPGEVPGAFEQRLARVQVGLVEHELEQVP